MFFKGVDFFPHGTRFKIIDKRVLFVGLSWFLAIASCVLLATRGLNVGVDFKGGSLIEVQTKEGPVNIAAVREAVGRLGLGDVQVQGTIKNNEALIRIALQPDERQQTAANDKVKAALADTMVVRRIEAVGPAVSSELRTWGIVSVFVSLLGILLYVWFRFEWQFAAAGVIALFHDVLITVGIFSFLWLEFDLAVVAAVLTLAGYSINDTVVIFDRIRDNLRKYKKMPLEGLLDLSINETLSRTILTSSTVFLAVLALLMLGTGEIFGFTFAMAFGILIGTYSSIFVASPLLLYFGVKREGWSGDAKPKVDALSAASAKAASEGAEAGRTARQESKAAKPEPKSAAAKSPSPAKEAAGTSGPAPKSKPAATSASTAEPAADGETGGSEAAAKPAKPAAKPQFQGLKGVPKPGEVKPKVRL
jgi:preprotein translocase SecF subunit